MLHTELIRQQYILDKLKSQNKCADISSIHHRIIKISNLSIYFGNKMTLLQNWCSLFSAPNMQP